MKRTTAMKTTMKMTLGSLVACLALGAMADTPTISDVVVRQRWPWSRLVNIDYVLSCDATQRVDVAVAAYDGSAALTLPTDSLSGDLYGVAPGAGRIVWDPTKSAYTNNILTRFRVTLTPTFSPVYMILDLTKAAGASDQVEYIYPGDARLVTYGRFTNVWFGVTNDSVYATTKLVLRHVHAGSFKMGDNVNISTTLTKDFYAGVFEVTEAQWQMIMNGTVGTSMKPKALVSYNDIRGATNSVPSVNWPTTGTTVSSTSLIGELRAVTGLTTFDLPTDAQFEYLCRAGTTSYYNDGESSSADTSVLNRLAWWLNNSSGATHTVGGKEMNGWGLYDTHGNVWEMCLDWSASQTGGTDPVGPTSGSARVCRCGAYDSAANRNSSSARGTAAPSDSTGSVKGFRLILNLP